MSTITIKAPSFNTFCLLHSIQTHIFFDVKQKQKFKWKNINLTFRRIPKQKKKNKKWEENVRKCRRFLFIVLPVNESFYLPAFFSFPLSLILLTCFKRTKKCFFYERMCDDKLIFLVELRVKRLEKLYSFFFSFISLVDTKELIVHLRAWNLFVTTFSNYSVFFVFCGRLIKFLFDILKLHAFHCLRLAFIVLYFSFFQWLIGVWIKNARPHKFSSPIRYVV